MAKVLVVDDEPELLRHLCAIIEEEGHEVRTAETGASAVRIGQTFRPKVLLADWKLKGDMSGLDVAKVLHAEDSSLATILMTGCAAADLQSQVAGLPFVCTLEKPFGIDIVQEMVDRAARL